MILPTVRNYALYALRGNPDEKCHILLACMPKSGSTYTQKVLRNLETFKRVHLVSQYGRREQELDFHACIKSMGKNYVAQHHVRCSQATKDLVQLFRMKPVVLTRNIFDAMISLRDHIRTESNVFPMAYLDQDARTWDDERLECFLTDFAAPWYFNFYVSWYHYEHKLHVTYEEMKADRIGYFAKILDFAGLDASEDNIHAMLERSRLEDTRKNKGVSGRGADIAERARQKIHELASHYPDVDFSPIGL